MKWLKRLVVLLVLLLVLAVGGFLGYVALGNSRNAPMPEAELALQSDTQVTVVADGWLIFQPTSQQPTTGLIFYPGGLVPPAGYAPLARAIAAEGFLVVITPMPLNLAIFDVDAALGVIAAFPDVQRWALGGHSLGGAAAAIQLANEPGPIAGLLLLASFPPESAELSDTRLAVLSLYGTEDGLATVAEVEKTAVLLPPTTQFTPIAGGNHTQFGWYGEGLQAGDAAATISREAQQQLVAEKTAVFLAGLPGS